MVSDNNNKSAEINFFLRRYPIPFWMLVIIAIFFILITWLIAKLPQQNKAAQPAINNAQDCDSGLEEGEFTCSDRPGYQMVLNNVPSEVTPGLLPISDEEEAELREYPTDGVGCVVSIAGNLVFYEKENNNNPVTSFFEPVRLIINYTNNDASILQTDINNFLENNSNSELAQCLQAKSISTVEDIVPIYLYTPEFDTNIHIWKPFQNFTIDKANNEMTIEFLYWGDQQAGGGTRP
jgi:hypothetical protein